jgi:hypothetical protein
MINDVSSEKGVNKLHLNKDFKLPSQMVPVEYLTSSKLLARHERQALRVKFRTPVPNIMLAKPVTSFIM